MYIAIYLGVNNPRSPHWRAPSRNVVCLLLSERRLPTPHTHGRGSSWLHRCIGGPPPTRLSPHTPHHHQDQPRTAGRAGRPSRPPDARPSLPGPPGKPMSVIQSLPPRAGRPSVWRQDRRPDPPGQSSPPPHCRRRALWPAARGFASLSRPVEAGRRASCPVPTCQSSLQAPPSTPPHRPPPPNHPSRTGQRLSSLFMFSLHTNRGSRPPTSVVGAACGGGGGSNAPSGGVSSLPPPPPAGRAAPPGSGPAGERDRLGHRAATSCSRRGALPPARGPPLGGHCE